MLRSLVWAACVILAASPCVGAEPLPSWNDSASKRAILTFLERATREGDPNYVAPSERIAVFDNDGTLWCEQPTYVQLAFARDRVIQLAPQHPEWRSQQPFQAVLEGDLKALAATGEHGIVQLVMASHAGMTADEFTETVKSWLQTATHPVLKRPYTECVYQPMLEVLTHFRSKGFRTYIVSGGGIEFVRAWAEDVYGIPPHQVIGSSIRTQYQVLKGRPVLMRQPEIDFVDDKAGKPVGIHKFIGQRPVAAFGNSDGDYEMLQYTTASSPGRLGVIIRHTDGEREFEYDRQSSVGRLAKALDDAEQNGWVVVDMKRDWSEVFPAPIRR